MIDAPARRHLPAAAVVITAAALAAAACDSGAKRSASDTSHIADGQTAAPTSARDSLALGAPERVIDSIRAPESVAIGPDGRYYVSSFGEFGKERDGTIVAVDPEGGRKSVYARGLLDPTGIAFRGDTLWVADRDGVSRITRDGKVTAVAPASRFPRKAWFLNDIAIDRDGSVLVSDTGDEATKTGGGVYRLRANGRPDLIPRSDSGMSTANGLLIDRDGSILAVGYRTGVLARTDGRGSWQELARGLGGPDGIALDREGRLFVTDNVGGPVYLITDLRSTATPRKIADGLKSPADLIVDEKRRLVVIPENGADRVAIYRLPR